MGARLIGGYATAASPFGIRGRSRGREKNRLGGLPEIFSHLCLLRAGKEEFTRITRVLNARLGLNGPCLRDVYLGSSIFYQTLH